MMLTSGYLIFICGFVGGISYLFGLSRQSRDLAEMVAAFKQLSQYATEVEEENTNLRAACDESPWGPMRMNPSPARSSHLSVVK